MRDKKMIMKQRGYWTGGEAPIGYDLRGGKLVRNAQDARAVRCMFETYAAEKRLTAVHSKLAADGFRRRVRTSEDGTRRGGNPVAVTAIRHILCNPVYVGDVRHRGQRYPGIHEPIVDRELWDRVQQILEERRVSSPQRPSNLLTGLLFDGHGRRMHARGSKGNWGEFRYYVSSPAAWAIDQKMRPVRARAYQLEELVLQSLKELLSDRLKLRMLLMKAGIFGPELDRIAAAGPGASERMGRLSAHQLFCAFRALVQRIEVLPELVRIVLRADAMPRFIAWDGVGLFALDELDLPRANPLDVIDVAASMDRARKKYRLPVMCREGPPKKPDKGLISLLGHAREAQRLFLENRDLAVADVAACAGKRPALFARLVRLNYLAPDILAAITDGTQPPGMTRKSLMALELPTDWALQRRLLGFAPPHRLPAVEQDSSVRDRLSGAAVSLQGERDRREAAKEYPGWS